MLKRIEAESCSLLVVVLWNHCVLLGLWYLDLHGQDTSHKHQEHFLFRFFGKEMYRSRMLLNSEYTADRSGPVALPVSLTPVFSTTCYPVPSSLQRALPVPLVVALQPFYPVRLQGDSAQLAERWARLKMGTWSIPYWKHIFQIQRKEIHPISNQNFFPSL